MHYNGFIFDYARCVGCHACVVACYNENGVQPPVLWRQVVGVNPEKVPLYGFVSLSMACNHCTDAPCLKACPASAYYRDQETGAILHSNKRCIGCKYCTWACPFDAPKYNPLRGVVEKCTMCNERLKSGEIPACTEACPTGALSFGSIETAASIQAPGISAKPFSPRIVTKNEDIVNHIPHIDEQVTGYSPLQHTGMKHFAPSKINPIHELPLAIFTLICSLMVGWVGSMPWVGIASRGITLFILLGIVGALLSTFHLGKPFRALRSVANVKSSWLSREILLFTLFFSLSALNLIFFNLIVLSVIAVILGLLLLVAVEMVYSVTDKKYKIHVHSANVVITALTIFSIFSSFERLLVLVLVLKAALYILRHANYSVSSLEFIFSFIRVFLGILIPLGSIFFSNQHISMLMILFILIGELIDRIEFYGEQQVDTPRLLANNFWDKSSV